jgi:hypothetical protein
MRHTEQILQKQTELANISFFPFVAFFYLRLGASPVPSAAGGARWPPPNARHLPCQRRHAAALPAPLRCCPACADAPVVPPAPSTTGLALRAARNFASADRGSLEISSKFASNCLDSTGNRSERFFRSTGGHPGSNKEATKAEYKPETTPQKAKVCRG